jgi:hypothetical protein
MTAYAKRHGFDLVVRQTATGPWAGGVSQSVQSTGRLEKLAAGKLLDLYDKVIVLDDTCFVAPSCPSLVDLVPENAIGCVLEKYSPPPDLLAKYLRYHQRHYRLPAPLPVASFFNTGVLVLSRRHKDLFAVANADIMAAAEDAWYGDQGLIAKRAFELQIDLADLGVDFNFVGSMIHRAGGPDFAPTSTRIFHLTSFLTVEQRVQHSETLDRIFSSMSR